MIRSFADAATEDIFSGRDTKAARAFAKTLWRAIRRKLVVIDASVAVSDLSVLPGNRLEKLRGDRSGRYSIRVNDQYRITFRFEEEHAYDVGVEDYH